MYNRNEIKRVIIGLTKQELIILAKLKEKMLLSDETQFQTDNLGQILKMSCPTLIGYLSRICKFPFIQLDFWIFSASIFFQSIKSSEVFKPHFNLLAKASIKCSDLMVGR